MKARCGSRDPGFGMSAPLQDCRCVLCFEIKGPTSSRGRAKVQSLTATGVFKHGACPVVTIGRMKLWSRVIHPGSWVVGINLLDGSMHATGAWCRHLTFSLWSALTHSSVRISMLAGEFGLGSCTASKTKNAMLRGACMMHGTYETKRLLEGLFVSP